MRRRLAKLRDTYGLNVAGEGGEYETLTLDAPIGVFPRGRVEFVEGSAGAAASDGERSEGGWRLVVTSEDAVAPGGVLVPVSFLVVPRDGGGDDEQPSGQVVEVPRAYEAPAPAEEGQAEEREDASKGGESGGLRTQVLVRLTKDHAVVGCRVHQCRVGGGGPVAPPTADATARAVRLALRAVERAANPSSSSSSTPVWPRALFVHLLLRDMAHFAAANAAYCSVVPLLRPPARACVEAALPDGCLLHVDVLMLRGAVGASGEGGGVDGAEEKQEDAAAANDNNDDDDDGVGGERAQAAMGRRVLHVQSISPWAPACIGPYSQAAADGRGGLLHLAGQIPLDPASMAMLGPAAAADEEGGGGGGGGGDNGGCSCSPATLLKHTDRVLRSCQAVAVASGGRMDGGACAGAAVYLSPEARAAAGTAAVAVAGFLRQGRTAQEQQQQQSDEGDEEDEDHDDFVDEYLRPLQLPRERVRVTQASWSVGSGEGGGGGGAAAADGDAAAAAPCVYAVVPALPRGSLVEAQPTLLDLRAFAPGGGAGEPPSSSSSSSEDEEEEEEDEPAATASAAAAPPLAADAAALAAATGATAHLRAYSWLSRGSPPAGRRGRQPPQRRLAARLLVALPAGGTEGGQHCDAAAAVVASALAEASRNGVIADATAPLNVVSLRAWCTPEAYAELAGGVEEEQEDEGDGGRSPLDAALARLGAPCGAQLLPADEVRWCCPGGDDDDHAATLSPPCAAVFELVVLQ
jgi:diphthine-ammonia ligase